MLETVQELGDSVTREQLKSLKDVLGDELFGLLDHAFDSETDEEAKERIAAFVAKAKKKSNALRILKARRLLDAEQKKMIMQFLGD